MQLSINDGLKGCPKNCLHHDLHVWQNFESWGGDLASIAINVRCKHYIVCKLRKEVEDGEEHNADGA